MGHQDSATWRFQFILRRRCICCFIRVLPVPAGSLWSRQPPRFCPKVRENTKFIMFRSSNDTLAVLIQLVSRHLLLSLLFCSSSAGRSMHRARHRPARLVVVMSMESCLRCMNISIPPGRRVPLSCRSRYRRRPSAVAPCCLPEHRHSAS